MPAVEDYRSLVEEYLGALSLSPELGRLEEVMRYTLHAGGKRIRPVLCLATGEAAGGEAERLLPAAAALELVHTFSLVHDDLPALDDDPVRRGRPSAHVEFGEARAILAGDALLAEAFRLALSYPTTAVARELADATLGMIAGQGRDIEGEASDLAALHRLKTGRLFAAAVGSALWVVGTPGPEQAPWRAFADEFGLLFQIVDDVIDEDGFARALGPAGARALAEETAGRARARLDQIEAGTSVLAELVSGLSARGQAR